jgi:phenylacetate-CoA ligase
MSARALLPAAGDFLRALRSEWYPAERLQAEQQERLLEQLRHAYTHVPFYRRRWPQDPVEILRSGAFGALPLVRRETVQACPEDFLAETGDRSTWQRSKTSGSTARPLESWLDARAWQQCKYSLKFRRLLASGWRPGHRVCIVEAVAAEALAEHADSYALPGERWLQPRRYLSLFEPTESHLEHYRSFRPHHIYAPMSYLAGLARLWSEADRRRIPLHTLQTSGEWFHPETRRRVSERFGVPVLDVYGSTEFKEIAWQCRELTGYHVNMESVLVEVLDERGAPAPAGTAGEVVVTSLTNRAMPLIRYVTGDRAAARAGVCDCGRESLRLDAFEGRTVDVLALPDGRRISPYALTTAVETCPGVLQYRIVQLERDRLDVPIVLPGASESALAALRTTLAGVVGPAVKVDVRVVSDLPREPSGKCRPVAMARSLQGEESRA